MSSTRTGHTQSFLECGRSMLSAGREHADMSNAQRRREQRHRNKTYPGLMTPQRVVDHQLTQERLADLERLRKLVVAQLDVEERQERGRGRTGV